MKESGGWTVKCLYKLRKKHNIQIKDLQNIRICVEYAEDNPHHLERSDEKEDNVPEGIFQQYCSLKIKCSTYQQLIIIFFSLNPKD